MKRIFHATIVTLVLFLTASVCSAVDPLDATKPSNKDTIASVTSYERETRTKVNEVITNIPDIANWEVVTGGDSPVSGDKLAVDTASIPCTITLPASPATGAFIYLTDPKSTWGTNNVTLDRNGTKINGVAANYTLSSSGLTVTLIYTGSAYGWGVANAYVMVTADITTPTTIPALVSGSQLRTAALRAIQRTNVETLSGNKVLLYSDAATQVLDPNGSTRNVTLPDPALCTYQAFFIANVGTSPLLNVKDNGSAQLRELRAGYSGTFYSDGLAWREVGMRADARRTGYPATEAQLIADNASTSVDKIELIADVTLTAPLTITAGKVYSASPGAIITTTAANILTFATGSHLQDNGGQMFNAMSGEVVFGASSVSVVNPKWWGATGDANLITGAGTNDSYAVQAAFDSVNDGDTVYFPPGVYRFEATVTPTVRCNILGQNAVIFWAGASSYPISFGQTSSVLSTTLNGATLKAAVSLTLNSVVGIAVGDMIKITDTANQWPYDPRARVYYGEVNRVRAVGASSVDLEIPAATAYADASTVVIVRLWKNVSVRGLTIKTAASSNSLSGIGVAWTDTAIVEDCHFENMGSGGLFDVENIGLIVRGCTFRNLYYAGLGLGYGIQVNSSIQTHISSCQFFNCRRGVDFSGSVPSRYSQVVGCLAQGERTITGGTEGINGFGTHGSAEYITFQNCDVIGFYVGWIIRGNHITLNGCNGYSIASSFISHPTGTGINLFNCTLKGYSVASGTNPYPCAIYLDVTSSDVGKGVNSVQIKGGSSDIYYSLVSLGAAVPASTIYIQDHQLNTRLATNKLVEVANHAAPTTIVVEADNVKGTFANNNDLVLATTVGSNVTLTVRGVETKGTAVVASGATTTDVTHNQPSTPAGTDIEITPTGWGNAAKYWVSDIGATTFRINVDADPGVGTATFSWRVKVQ